MDQNSGLVGSSKQSPSRLNLEKGKLPRIIEESGASIGRSEFLFYFSK
jgi:hypothetical protein